MSSKDNLLKELADALKSIDTVDVNCVHDVAITPTASVTNYTSASSSEMEVVPLADGTLYYSTKTGDISAPIYDSGGTMVGYGSVPSVTTTPWVTVTDPSIGKANISTIDPRVDSLMSEVAELKQEIKGLKNIIKLLNQYLIPEEESNA